MKKGQSPHEPTEKSRKKVAALAGRGCRYEDIALMLDITDDCLKKHYFKELRLGVSDANDCVAQTLYSKAIKGDTASMIFWLRTRGRWRVAVDDDEKPTPPQVVIIRTNGTSEEISTGPLPSV